MSKLVAQRLFFITLLAWMGSAGLLAGCGRRPLGETGLRNEGLVVRLAPGFQYSSQEGKLKVRVFIENHGPSDVLIGRISDIRWSITGPGNYIIMQWSGSGSKHPERFHVLPPIPPDREYLLIDEFLVREQTIRVSDGFILGESMVKLGMYLRVLDVTFDPQFEKWTARERGVLWETKAVPEADGNWRVLDPP